MVLQSFLLLLQSCFGISFWLKIWFSLRNLIHDWAGDLYSFLVWFLAFLWKFHHWLHATWIASSQHFDTLVFFKLVILTLSFVRRINSYQLELSWRNLKLLSLIALVIGLVASLIHLIRLSIFKALVLKQVILIRVSILSSCVVNFAEQLKFFKFNDLVLEWCFRSWSILASLNSRSF